MAVLKILRGAAPQREYPIGTDRVVLGRERTCEVCLKRQEISRQHAILVRSPDGYQIIDCDSHNGTLLNGQRLQPQQPYPLEHHDLIQVGSFTFSFEEDSGDVWSCGLSSGFGEELLTSPSALPPTDQREIDSQCDQFESVWRSGGMPQIEDALGPWAGPQHDDLRDKLLHELVQIDMEYRWRDFPDISATGRPRPQADPASAGDAVGNPPGADPSRLPLRPLLEDYLARYPELTFHGRPQLRLIATEFRVRQQWGDRPTYLDFRGRFPEADHELESALRSVALKLTPTVMRIYEEGTIRFSRVFSLPLELGRQREGEPAPFGRVPLGNGERIIIAPSHEFMVSRTQLYVDIVAKDEFLLENRSMKSSLDLGGDEELAPGESRQCSTPVSISLGKKTIRLEPS
jgi:hypothetical protein